MCDAKFLIEQESKPKFYAYFYAYQYMLCTISKHTGICVGLNKNRLAFTKLKFNITLLPLRIACRHENVAHIRPNIALFYCTLICRSPIVSLKIGQCPSWS